MAWGLEARVPFLDHELVEFATRIPTEYKIHDGSGKWLLKEASRSIIPHEVIDRPKGYFPVPALKNLSGKTLEFMKDTVLSSKSMKRNIFTRDYIQKLVDNPQAHLTPTGVSKLYQIAVFEHWMDVHG
jgi:asparagine synthase (glutamine-hydrolysing)